MQLARVALPSPESFMTVEFCLRISNHHSQDLFEFSNRDPKKRTPALVLWTNMLIPLQVSVD